MKRKRFDQATTEELSQVIRDIEQTTDAEIVVVVRGRSGSYRHADYLCGSLIAFAGLLFILLSRFNFHTYWVPVDVVLLFAAGAFISSRTDSIRRLLTTSSSRVKAARMGAAAMFYEAGIANTHAENGLLIYLSLLERQLEVIADRGVLKSVSALAWNQTVSDLKKVGRKPEPAIFIGALRELGKLLAEHLPATGDNPNELADGPRIELK